MFFSSCDTNACSNQKENFEKETSWYETPHGREALHKKKKNTITDVEKWPHKSILSSQSLILIGNCATTKQHVLAIVNRYIWCTKCKKYWIMLTFFTMVNWWSGYVLQYKVYSISLMNNYNKVNKVLKI